MNNDNNNKDNNNIINNNNKDKDIFQRQGEHQWQQLQRQQPQQHQSGYW